VKQISVLCLPRLKQSSMDQPLLSNISVLLCVSGLCIYLCSSA